ncbi:MAG TPA: hydrogenase maturation protease [Verrucomicrobiae bacterium]|nr:hydrogenase maturation protease [Verrucomicrobiae bacterium]
MKAIAVTRESLPPAPATPERACVIGLGNVLLGDDGFGPWAVEMFRCRYECGPNVEILDLGTPGLDLAPYLYGRDLVVIADAVQAREQPGTLRIYFEAALLARPGLIRTSAHDPGVQESLAQLRLAGHAPSELIILGVVPESSGLGTGLSLPVLRNSGVAVDNLARLLRERGIDCRSRPTPIQPNFWWLSGDRPELAHHERDHNQMRRIPLGSERSCHAAASR